MSRDEELDASVISALAKFQLLVERAGHKPSPVVLAAVDELARTLRAVALETFQWH